MSVMLEVAPRWQPPPDDECDQLGDVTVHPAGADPGTDRIIYRLKYQVIPYELVEFAIIQQTFYRGEWTHVVIVDSTHDDEVHLHRYGQQAKQRVGPTEQLVAVSCQADIATGFRLGHDQVVARWVDNKARWHYG